MDRRTVLRGTGTLLVGLTAGCLGEEDTDFQLRVVDEDFGPGEDGNLTVWITVSNPGNEAQSGIVYLSAEVNDESKVRTRTVSLDAHETTQIEIGFETPYDEVTGFDMGDASVEPKTSSE